MAAENVIEKILADARAEAGKIVQQAREREAAEQAKLEEQLGRFREQTEALARKAADDERSHLLAAARMRVALEYLAAKTQILDEVFAQARQQLRSLPDAEYRDLMVRLMTQAVESGEEEVQVGRGEKRIDQDLVGRVNQELAGRDKGHLKLSRDKANADGGFLLRRGRIKTNVSHDVLLEQAREALVIPLARELFA